MTTKHTPGPWQAQDYWIIGCVEDSWDIMAGANTACPWRVAKVFRSEADARLIAAAPDMLDALRGAVEDNLSVCYDDGIKDHWLGCCRAHASQGHAADCWKTKARAAIAKAEGRE